MKKKLMVLIMALAVILVGCSGGDDKSGQVDQEAGKDLSIGIIQYSEHESLDLAREGLLDELNNLGYNVDADFVNVQEDMTLIPTTAAQFQGKNVDLIYAIATPAAQGMMNAVTDIPIVFNAVTDPEDAGLTADNITGVSDYYPIKGQLELFMEDFPDLTEYGVIYATGEANSEVQIEELRQVAEELGINIHEVGVTTTNDIPQALSSLTGQIEAYIMITDNMTVSAAPVIANGLKEAKIPSFTVAPSPVNDGILLSDGIDYYSLGQQAGDIVDQIINGTSPSEIEVQYPENASRMVNRTTARELAIEDDASLYDNAVVVD